MQYLNGRPQLEIAGTWYQPDIPGAPAPAPAGVASGVTTFQRTRTGISPAEAAAGRNDQQTMCSQAMAAYARKSPAYANLALQCANLRRANVLAGNYVADAMSADDGAYRVALTDAGEVVVSRDPALQQVRARLNPDQARGFTMAQGVRAGLIDPAFLAFASRGLASYPELLKGFNDAMAAPNLTQGVAAPDDGGGIPRNVLIAGGVVAVLGVAAVVFKLSRKR